MTQPVKIIDLFAGPGGLGEGFSAYQHESSSRSFKIALSVENEPSAHQTLTLRSFYRQFAAGEAPDDYYSYLNGKSGKYPDDSLFQQTRLRKQVAAAKAESRLLTLGVQNRAINTAVTQALGKRPGPWVLIGGPPCQAYSLVGRSRNKGKKNYAAESDHRNFLYKEYLKIIARFHPAIFVMENVKGLLSAKLNGASIFEQIRNDLMCPVRALGSRYKKYAYELFSFTMPDDSNDLFDSTFTANDFVIRSERYGVPQTRHRVIILGVRTDYLRRANIKTISECNAASIEDVIGDLPNIRSGLSKLEDTFENWSSGIVRGAKKLAPAVGASGHPLVAKGMLAALPTIKSAELTRGGNWATVIRPRRSSSLPAYLASWYADPSGRSFVINHESRGHITGDLLRYLFCASFAATNTVGRMRSPSSTDFPDALSPKHANWKSGSFSDRFRVQVSNQVATTITSHISKDGHYYVHYDPTQCRSLTVREAARIQTFPDNYFFVGNRTQQYVQVGNAVPPYLAHQLADTVFNILYR